MAVSPTRVVLVYAEQDALHGERMAISLAALLREGAISLWHESDILPSALRDEEIEKAVISAEVVILLLSADLIAADDRLRLIERVLKERRARVIPVPVRPTDWEGLTILRSLKPLPPGGKPITDWRDQDAGWLEVVRGVRRLVAPLMVRVWVEPANRPPHRTRDIQLVPQIVRGDEFHIGARIRVGFQADRDCHLMLVNCGSSGRISLIYPHDQATASLCRGDVSYYFPGPTDLFEFVLREPPGREVIHAFASPAPPWSGSADPEALVRGPLPPGWAEARCEFDVG